MNSTVTPTMPSLVTQNGCAPTGLVGALLPLWLKDALPLGSDPEAEAWLEDLGSLELRPCAKTSCEDVGRANMDKTDAQVPALYELKYHATTGAFTFRCALLTEPGRYNVTLSGTARESGGEWVIELNAGSPRILWVSCCGGDNILLPEGTSIPTDMKADPGARTHHLVEDAA